METDSRIFGAFSERLTLSPHPGSDLSEIEK
jgi:hypothetical protein